MLIRSALHVYTETKFMVCLQKMYFNTISHHLQLIEMKLDLFFLSVTQAQRFYLTFNILFIHHHVGLFQIPEYGAVIRILIFHKAR